MAERIERYLETAGAQVRWKRVRPALKRELRTHLEEQTEAYLAEGMAEDAAEAEAVRQMGDAEAVGLALDAVHRPKKQTAILLFAGLAIVLGMYLRAELIGSSYAFTLAAGLLACGALIGGYYLDYRCLSRYAWYIYGAVLVLGAVCVYQTTFMGPGAPCMLGITVGDTSEYAALLYPAAYALVVYALQGKKGGFWLSLAAVAPFALPFLWDRYVGILPQLLFAVCAAAVLLSAIRAGLFQVKKNCARALVWALLVLAVAWPFMVSRGTVDIATLTMIYIILGLGLNVVVGLSGLLVLGYGGFYAIGAYTFALLNHYYGLGFWTCLPIAGLMAAAAGFLLGFPVLRLRGDYLAIVTLGFGEIVRILLLNNTEITGGPNGISQIPKPTLFGLEFSRTAREGGWDTFSNFFGLKYDPSDRVIFLYLVALLLVVLSLFVINRLLRMPLGRAWEALREDEIACRSLGLSPRRIKLTAFTISAAFAGFAGTLFAARQGFVSPESFTFAESAFVLAIVVLGGMGSQFAVILAAVLLVVSRELMRDFNEYSMLMLGGLMVLMMIWRPQGLLPMTRPQLKLKNGAAKGEQA